MYLSTLTEWLAWIASLHPTEMDLGLDRVKKVANRLQVLSPSCPVMMVGGTNGKGSTVAGLEAIYHAAGYRVGAFTSPILFKHNEQVRIERELASDKAFCDAFVKVEEARQGISLTAFEFCTLAALLIFKRTPLDVLILEIGLGGRLDAVNIIDADLSIVTNISIDHTNWLGNTREQIAYEKAGIYRKNKPAICGDKDPPATLIAASQQIGAKWFCQGRDFHYQKNLKHWSWSCADIEYENLPVNTLATQNMSTVLMAVTLMQSQLPVNRVAIDKGLNEATLPGRVQIIDGPVTEIYDVSHNPASVAYLAECLTLRTCAGKTHAVFSMLADKDMLESIQSIRNQIDVWYVAPLTVQRAASKDILHENFQQADIKHVKHFSSIQKAYDEAKQNAEKCDRIIVFGSFHTVSDVWRHVQGFNNC